MSSNYYTFESKISKYDHLIISSIDEGFCPFSDIKDGVLSTSENQKFDNLSQDDQENMVSTVFFKLIDNSKEVHLIYDSDLNSFMSGEESRYIKQLELLKTDSHICERKVIEQKVKIEKNESTIIIKDDLINQRLDTILKKGISASTLNLFKKNPYIFNEQKRIGINEFEDKKYLKDRDQGTRIHKVMQKRNDYGIGVELVENRIELYKKKINK